MSSEIAIKVDNLSKCYQIYDNPRDRLMQMLMRGRRQYYREFWALRDVSFEVRKGETLGIVGRNGSGKSTLLQMLCGTLNPTSGSIQASGRIAALLELGSGFNPEFTGRENVYMNGAVLGLCRNEVDQRFNDIAAFADIGEFIEYPVKTYSSGMMVRLAFAVAINANPDILIVDEALSVGDERFQRKCFSRIEAIRASGTTILFVSHSGAQIVELCDRAVLLDDGEKLAVGEPKLIVGRYQKLLYAPADMRDVIREQIRCMEEHSEVKKIYIESSMDKVSALDHDPELQEIFDPNLKPSSTIEYKSHGAYINSLAILTLAGRQVNNLVCGKTYCYRYVVNFTESATNILFGMLIKTTSGVELGGASSASSIQKALSFVKSGSEFQIDYHFECNLNSGVYFINAGVFGVKNGEEMYLHRVLDACIFRVLPRIENASSGFVNFNCTPKVHLRGDWMVLAQDEHC